MTKQQIYEDGKDRGIGFVRYFDIPEIGSAYSSDSMGDTEVTAENIEEICMDMFYRAESNDRDFSPFEFTAHTLNELQEKKPYDVWDLFEKGMIDGFKKEFLPKLQEFLIDSKRQEDES